MGRIIKDLNNQNIKLNITAVYTAKQTEKILSIINKNSKVIISIFAGRTADAGKDPIPELKKVSLKLKNLKMLKYYGQVREPTILCKLSN